MPKLASPGPSEPPTVVVAGVADSAYQEYGNEWDPGKGPTIFDAG